LPDEAAQMVTIRIIRIIRIIRKKITYSFFPT
jgi:hypothetical protein